MVRYRRNFLPGGSYFFTVTLADRRSTALVEHVGASRTAFRKGHFSSGLISLGIKPERNSNDDLALWQRRFWEHTILDEHDFERHVHYVHINPIKHGLVTRVRDWPHSSFHRHVRERSLPDDWAGTVHEFVGNYGER
jgi:putative transposase